jgi:hypothetical protein
MMNKRVKVNAGTLDEMGRRFVKSLCWRYRNIP